MTAVIFDLNGVLTNAAHINYSVLAEVFNKYSLGFDEQERFEVIMDMPADERDTALRERYLNVLEEMDDTPVIEDHTKEPDEEEEPADIIENLPEEFFDEIRALFSEREDAYLQATNGIEPLLKQLQMTGTPFYIAANDPVETIMKRLKEAGLGEYFTQDNIVSADNVRRPKPAPDIYRAAARKAGLDPKELIAVEAGPNGIKSASHAGAYVIGYTEHHYDFPGRGHVLFERGASELASNSRELTRMIFSKLGIPAPRLVSEADSNTPSLSSGNDSGSQRPSGPQQKPF